ncbi:replication initiation protein [Paenibacillus farraposensis]|nr:replication initiation protein [Paenibacillus farraposensis]
MKRELLMAAMSEEQMEFDFEPDAISDHFIVSESNALIEARTNLTLYEERIIYILASRIHPDDTNFKTHFFKVRDIAEVLNISHKTNDFYKQIREILDNLQNKKVIIHEQNLNSTLQAHWLAAARYYHGKGTIELEFSSMLKPYLLQLQQNFTKFKLWNVLYLKSTYSSKLYKLLKRYLPLGKRSFTLEELREKLEIEEGKYSRYSHLKNRILLGSQAELEMKTDIKFKLEEIKNGTKVVKIIFHISPNAKTDPAGINDTDFIDHEDTIQLLARFEVKKKVATVLIKKYGEQQIRENIKYVYEKKRNAEVSNMAGYIVKAIEENYADALKMFEPEDNQDAETSIINMNERIRQLIFFKDRCIEEGIVNETVGTQNLVKGVTQEIERIEKARQVKNFKPLTVDDFEDAKAKSIFEDYRRDRSTLPPKLESE